MSLVANYLENCPFNQWLRVALRPTVANARQIADEVVCAEIRVLKEQGIYRSDDEHVLALAGVSGARLLFTNDPALEKDFKNRRIINSGKGRGRVYTTRPTEQRPHKNVTSTHKRLLR